MGQRPLRLLMLASCVQLGFFTWAFYAAQPYLLDLLSSDAVWVAGLVAAGIALSTIAGNQLVEVLSRRCGRRTTLLLGAAAVETCAAVALGLVSSFWLALPALLLITAASGVTSPVRQAYLHQVVPSEQRATVVSFDSMISNAGGIGGQLGLGALGESRSIGSAFVVGGLATGLALPLLARLRAIGGAPDRIGGSDGRRREPVRRRPACPTWSPSRPTPTHAPSRRRAPRDSMSRSVTIYRDATERRHHMTAYAITGRRFHRDDRIHFMGGPHGRRRGRHFGPGQAFGRRAGRGDIRAAILALLVEEPMHGYQIIQELAERTGGVWRPSPGSVYPTLQQLEDEELVRETASESGKRVYELTDAGREQAAGAPAPWTAVAGENESELVDAARSRASGARGDAAGRPCGHRRPDRGGPGRAARRAASALYRLLAEDEDAAERSRKGRGSRMAPPPSPVLSRSRASRGRRRPDRARPGSRSAARRRPPG